MSERVIEVDENTPEPAGWVKVKGRPDPARMRHYLVKADQDCRTCNGRGRATRLIRHRELRKFVRGTMECGCVLSRLDDWIKAGEATIPAGDTPALTRQNFSALRHAQRLDQAAAELRDLEAKRKAALAPIDEQIAQAMGRTHFLEQERDETAGYCAEYERQAAVLTNQVELLRREAQKLERRAAMAREQANELRSGLLVQEQKLVDDARAEGLALVEQHARIWRRWDERMARPARTLERMRRRLNLGLGGAGEDSAHSPVAPGDSTGDAA